MGNTTEGQPNWHALSIEDTLQKVNSTTKGLTEEEADGRLEKYGYNAIPKYKKEGSLKLLWNQINNPLIYVLLASGTLALFMNKITDGFVVLGVVILNTLIGFIQELKAKKAIEALTHIMPEYATVIRNSNQISILSKDIVPGDIVLMQSGDKVPADIRLISVKNLRIEEATLTGESVPSEKQIEKVTDGSVINDRACIAYGGTFVSSGTALGVVVATGKDTEIGKISNLLQTAENLETPLTKSIAKVSKWLTIGIILVALILFGIGVIRGYTFIDATIAAITLAVAAIPEGLPAIITIALAIGVNRMAKRRAIIRKLPAVETLGSTSVICTDKTGTLTKNEMTVQVIHTSKGMYTISGVGYAPNGELRKDGKIIGKVPEDVEEILVASTLCNDASLLQEGSKWKITGDPTEAALIVAAKKLGINCLDTKNCWPRVDAIPFESEKKYMATLHEAPKKGQVVYLKGAPEVILKHCKTWENNKILDKKEIEKEIDNLASQGLRILAVAKYHPEKKISALDETHLNNGFALLGLEAMIDPPREEVIAAVRNCHSAGITVKMITGDHQETAKAIAKNLNILTSDGVLIGTELSKLSDTQLKEAVKKVNVFARVSPEHKIRIVKALQASNHIVAMTGDGVNDAPALKQANIGVAMGITGTAVSKEAADIVLTDDNFASIESAVEEGRRVYDNIIKALAFVLPTNLGEALIILIAVMLFPIHNGEPLMPILPVQILWINLVAAVTLALPLGFEAMERNIMKRPPRKPEEPILNRFVILRTIIVTLLMTLGSIGLFFFEYYSSLGNGIAQDLALKQAQTVAVTAIIMFQIFYLLNCRSLKESVFKIGLFTNNTIYMGIISILVLQTAFVYLPFMNSLFGSVPLSLFAWVEAIIAGAIILPVISLEKYLMQRKEKV